MVRILTKAPGFAAVLLLMHAVAHGAILGPGDSFPAWQLRDHTGAEVSSKDFAGKTYLLWYYPMAMTPGCTAEGKALRDEYPAFQKLGVEVVGISFDAPEANAEFVAAHGFPYRLLSDDGSLAEKVGASEGPDDRTARRISYLIGPDGKVLRAYETVTPAEHATQVLTDVRGAKPQPSP